MRSRSMIRLVLLLTLALSAPLEAAAPEAARGVVRLTLPARTVASTFQVPGPLPTVTGVYLAHDPQRTPLTFEQHADQAGVTLELPPQPAAAEATVLVETAAQSRQWSDGRISFLPRDAVAQEVATAFSRDCGEQRGAGGRSNALTWHYHPTRPGRYALEITYSLAGHQDAEVTIDVAGHQHPVTLAPTGRSSRYRVASAGKVKLIGNQKQTIRLAGLQKTASAEMTLAAVTLRPISEGSPPQQMADGSITCHARDVTIHGVRVQYEPQPHKNTVGCWTNADDTISWTFTVAQPGEFEVEVLQGCGAGHGGSEVELRLAEQSLRFTVEDTGHFQNFVPRLVGRVALGTPGAYTLVVVPIKKAKLAVMDVRQIRLLPVR